MQTVPKANKRIETQVDYMNNSRIMRVVQDSFGRLNERYKRNINEVQPVQLQPINNMHYMINGVNFVPVTTELPPMQMHRNSNIPIPMNSIAIKNELGYPQIEQNIQPPVKQFKLSHPSSRKTQPDSASTTSQNSSEVHSNTNKFNKIQTERYFFTGTIERVLRWNSILNEKFYLYETIAPVISLQEGSIPQQKIMLLRDKKGPILQVQYFTTTHLDIEDFYIGQYLRCVGRMIGLNILLAESIREAKDEEITTLPRLSYVCDYSVNHNVKKN